ncbi:MAG: DJ-1/PfpI family protein [Actinomycetota bacterium]
MQVAIVTLDGFNELDTFVAMTILGRVQRPDWSVAIASPASTVTSMNGVTVEAQMSLDELPAADAVIIGSGTKSREYAADSVFLTSMRLDPRRQLIGSQCSGARLLARLGLLEGLPVCTDSATRPWAVEAGLDVVHQPFSASGNIATAGGCLSSQYLAAWMIARLCGVDPARHALRSVAPVGEEDDHVERGMGHVLSTLRSPSPVRAGVRRPARST